MKNFIITIALLTLSLSSLAQVGLKGYNLGETKKAYYEKVRLGYSPFKIFTHHLNDGRCAYISAVPVDDRGHIDRVRPEKLTDLIKAFNTKFNIKLQYYTGSAMHKYGFWYAKKGDYSFYFIITDHNFTFTNSYQIKIILEKGELVKLYEKERASTIANSL